MGTAHKNTILQLLTPPHIDHISSQTPHPQNFANLFIISHKHKRQLIVTRLLLNRMPHTKNFVSLKSIFLLT